MKTKGTLFFVFVFIHQNYKFIILRKMLAERKEGQKIFTPFVIFLERED